MENPYHEILLDAGNPLEIIKRCNGYYECPRDKDGKRIGPLVGYAMRYTDAEGIERQYVGDVYYNIATAEQYPHVVDHFSWLLFHGIARLDLRSAINATVGAAMGGIILGHALGRVLECRTAYVEKKVTRLATEKERERSELTMNRHILRQGDTVAIVEDVCNNFSTTEQLIDIVRRFGGTAAAICCVVNRSPETSFNSIPVASVLHHPTPQYRQDDPLIADDIKRVGVVWKPKDAWKELMATRS